MIELIVTIILIGIIFAAVPGLLLKSVESDIASLEGEALYHAAAKIQEIIAQPHNSLLNRDDLRGKPLVINYGAGINPICPLVADGSITETRGVAELKSSASGIALKRDSLCYNASATDIIGGIGLVEPQSAINEYHGWTQRDFSQGYRLDVTITPISDNHVADFGNPPNWTNWPSAGAAPSDLLLITVRVAYDDTDETIGVLRYAASNVGKR